ncbi:MAG: SurA N-terminal domain-containing protein, partial [Pseudomonadota bacterium]|nr:SurA N-terminal domain-containing protein [Pseudomonadota bacterium]
MLQFIRSKVTSIFIKVLFGILILSFAIWGIGDIFMGNRDGEAVVSIGNKDYNANDFLSEYEKAKRAMRLPPEYEELVRPQIVESVTQSIVRNGLLSAETLDLNLVFGDAQLKKWVGQSETFRNDNGKFDPELLRQALFNSGLTEGEFFSSLREEMRNNQLISAVVGSI